LDNTKAITKEASLAQSGPVALSPTSVRWELDGSGRPSCHLPTSAGISSRLGYATDLLLCQKTV